MKVKTFEIKFDNPRGVFEAGKTLSGFVHLNLVEPLKLRNIKLCFVGDGKTFWDRRSGKNNQKYRARESYLNSFVTLVAVGAREESMKHPAGDHVYPFSVPLNSTIPSSFEGSGGYVRYYCKATIDRPWKSNSHVKRIFTVIHQLDLNCLPVAMPFYTEKSEEIEGCCCKDGSVNIALELNKTGYVPGEPIVYKISVTNYTSSMVNRISLELKQICTCFAYHEGVFGLSTSLKQKEFKSPFFLFNGQVKVEPQKTGIIHKATTVPSLPPSNLDGCQIIELKYFVVLKLPGFSGNAKIEKEIIIGTIPTMELLQIPPGPIVAPVVAPAVAPSAPADPSAPPAPGGPAGIFPPSYEEALAEPQQPPPPSYADCVFGTNTVRDEDDEDNTDGDVTWAPSYPYYDWSQHTATIPRGVVMSQAQMGARTSDDDPGDEGNSPSQM